MACPPGWSGMSDDLKALPRGSLAALDGGEFLGTVRSFVDAPTEHRREHAGDPCERRRSAAAPCRATTRVRAVPVNQRGAAPRILRCRLRSMSDSHRC